MISTALLAWNLEEVRRRSRKIWDAIPADRLGWKPDADAMTCIEMVRHVLEGEYLYHSMLKAGGSLASDESPFSGRPYTTIASELQFAAPYREELMAFVRNLSDADLDTMKVRRSDKGYVRAAGDFILRMAYHESVHAGQLMGYLRTLGATRPNIWD
jgi:uncharacterized damage-inducible protein DinB